MKELIILATIVPGILLAPFNPVAGILTWTWVSIGNPHRLVFYSWVAFQPWAYMIALGTMAGMARNKGNLSLPMSREIKTLIAFMVWMVITTLMAVFPDDSMVQMNKVMKIDVMTLAAAAVLRTRRDIFMLVGVLVVSLGYYGVKGGIFTILSGGSERVWGPDGTYIEGNNELALALIEAAPLMRFMQLQAQTVWSKRLFAAMMGLSVVSALGSQSRGAMLAVVAMSLVMWWRSNSKGTGVVIMFVAVLGVLAFMPQSWKDRMGSIQGAEKKDDSAKGRINAWVMCYNIATHHFFGVGYDAYNRFTYENYAPEIPLGATGQPTYFAAHSIYFSMMGEHGFVGFTLFFMLWVFTWFTGGWLRTHASGRPETQWAADLGAMCQVSVAGYLVGGAFLSLSYFDLPYNVLILAVLARRWVETKSWEKEPSDGKGLLVKYFGYVAGGSVGGAPVEEDTSKKVPPRRGQLGPRQMPPPPVRQGMPQRQIPQPPVRQGMVRPPPPEPPDRPMNRQPVPRQMPPQAPVRQPMSRPVPPPVHQQGGVTRQPPAAPPRQAGPVPNPPLVRREPTQRAGPAQARTRPPTAEPAPPLRQPPSGQATADPPAIRRPPPRRPPE